MVLGHLVLRVSGGKTTVRVGEHANDLRKDPRAEHSLSETHVDLVQGSHLAAPAQEWSGTNHSVGGDATSVDSGELC